jgi:hypothetical protein
MPRIGRRELPVLLQTGFIQNVAPTERCADDSQTLEGLQLAGLKCLRP